MEALQIRILQKDRNESNWYYYVVNLVEDKMNIISKKPTIKKKLVKQAFFLFFAKNKIMLLTKRV